jgi:hypothetical protein
MMFALLTVADRFDHPSVATRPYNDGVAMAAEKVPERR